MHGVSRLEADPLQLGGTPEHPRCQPYSIRSHREKCSHSATSLRVRVGTDLYFYHLRRHLPVLACINAIEDNHDRFGFQTYAGLVLIVERTIQA